MNAPESALAKRFGRAMSAFPQHEKQPVVIGFSGGGDSLALLALACANADKATIHALIVDHGLRPDSAAEAKNAADMATALGAKPQILRWQTPRGGHKHARIARYGLLAMACRELGATTLYLAHTLDDQEETFCIRLARGSTARGLACMSAFSPFPVWPQGRDLWLARPLLGTRRQTLRHWLKGQHLDWIDDPSNCNRRFTRVRWREKLAELHRAGLAGERIAHSVQLLGHLENRHRQGARALLASCARWHQAGYAVLDFSHITSAPMAEHETALAAVLVACAGAGAVPLPILAARSTIKRLIAEPKAGFSVAGCHLKLKGTDVLVSRDPGAVLGRAPARKMKCVWAEKGRKTLYDDRFEIIASDDGWIEALGRRSAKLPQEAYTRLMALPAAIRSSLPVIRDQNDALSSPLLGGKGVCKFLGPSIVSRNLAPFSHITG